MGLPAKLTEEEQALLEKYALLKKMKKELQEKQAAASLESQKSLQTTKKEGKDVARAPSYAKELAKQKILSGELKIKRDDGQREFKRARSFIEKRPDGGERNRLDDVESNDIRPDDEKRQMKPPGRSHYESSFVHGGRLQESPPDKFDQSRQRFADRGKKKIFVSGYGLTEAILQNSFKKFGAIVNIHPELAKGQGFITFETHEAAEKAIEEMHGEMVQKITLKVSMAGRPNRRDGAYDRRPYEDRRDRFQAGVKMPSRDSQSHAESATFSQDSKRAADRDLVTYDDDGSFF